MSISDWSSDVCSSDLAVENFLQILAEAHVEHLVGFVQHDGLEAGKVERAAFQMVAQAARRADDDMRAVAESAAFLGGVHAADAGCDAGAGAAVSDAGAGAGVGVSTGIGHRSEEHTSELQSLMRSSYAVFCLKKKNRTTTHRAVDKKKQ